MRRISTRFPNRRFQSTPSVWRETLRSGARRLSCCYFNPLPPCGGRPATEHIVDSPEDFNPLPPCGGRHRCCVDCLWKLIFQSTPSVWRETITFPKSSRDFANFNPLPPCGGRRLSSTERRLTLRNFNPLPPCGGRPDKSASSNAPRHFNPLPPCGGRPLQTAGLSRQPPFQSTPSVWRETVKMQSGTPK